MEDENMPPSIVVDCGTSFSRMGFSTNPVPKFVIPTLVGRPRMKSKVKDVTLSYVGDEARKLQVEKDLAVKYPVEYGIITNWDDIERIYHYLIYDQLKADPGSHPFIVSDPAMTPIANREKLIQILFETFNVPALCFMKSPEASLLATGRKTGMVVDMGGGSCIPVAVADGYTLPRTAAKTLICGKDQTYYLLKLLTDKQVLNLEAKNCWVIANDIKENLCYTAQNYEEEMSNFSWQHERDYELPNGHTIKLGPERIQCPESIFKTHLNECEMPGLHETVYNTIMHHCDRDLQPQLFANILLCGGGAQFTGLASRMQSELSTLAGPKFKIGVIAPGDKHLAFRGMAALASSPGSLHRFITKEFYDEYGPAAVCKISF